jgi:hypothetical protein
MIHHQISVKFDEDTHNEISEITGCMRMNKHAFIVNAVKETLHMIRDQGKERIPLLVVQAQTAQKFAQEAPPLPIRSDASPSKSARKRQGKD